MWRVDGTLDFRYCQCILWRVWPPDLRVGDYFHLPDAYSQRVSRERFSLAVAAFRFAVRAFGQSGLCCFCCLGAYAVIRLRWEGAVAVLLPRGCAVDPLRRFDGGCVLHSFSSTGRPPPLKEPLGAGWSPQGFLKRGKALGDPHVEFHQRTKHRIPKRDFHCTTIIGVTYLLFCFGCFISRSLFGPPGLLFILGGGALLRVPYLGLLIMGSLLKLNDFELKAEEASLASLIISILIENE